MSWVAVGAAGIGAAGSIAGGFLGSSGSNKQIAAMREAIQYQRERDAQTRKDLAPYRQFGGEQLNSLTGWLNDPTNNPMSHLDPGYQFRRDQGNVGIANNAATAGLLQSGDTLRGLTQYGQDMSSQEYNNAFNRYLGEGQFKQGLAGMGENATLAGALYANQGAANVGNMTANTNFAAPDQIWGNVAAGLGGGVSNALALRMRQQQQQTPGGSNIFGTANPSNPAGATTPYYMQAP